MTDITLDQLRAELAPIKARVDGIPFITRQLETLRQELRQLKAAFNDFALTNVTAGEISALHHDVNDIQSNTHGA